LAINSGASSDVAYRAMIAGQLGRMADVKEAVARLRKIDPEWSAESCVFSAAGFARETETNLLIESARKACQAA